MATISNYNKHLTLSERIKIEQALDKGISFRKISEDIHNMMCHINSTPRKSLNWKSPYEVFVEMFNKETLDKLDIYQVESKNIILNKKLFR